MNFFEQQDRARRQTALLVVLFVLTLILIAVAVYLAVMLTRFSLSKMIPLCAFQTRSGLWVPEIFWTTCAAVAMIVAGGVIQKIQELQGGGPSVAKMLGGRCLLPETVEPRERMTLNVVEEMAIASGVPIPQVYLLDDEPGINAFAAGYTPLDAVIGITSGAVQGLSRDEMQGVIAHEFSHIFNGDMALNFRLITLLHGILALHVLGSIMLDGSRQTRAMRKNGTIGSVLGLSFWFIGLIGVFFGRIIQAAVSRQREYLADASAVQFTRNPQGLAGALKKIGGLAGRGTLKSPAAESARHLFFAESGRSFFLAIFATHPPLKQRVKLLEPDFDGNFPRIDPAAFSRLADAPQDLVSRAEAVPDPAKPTVLQKVSENISSSAGTLTDLDLQAAGDLMKSLPPYLAEMAHDPAGSRAIILALLLGDQERVRKVQMKILAESSNRVVYRHLTQIEDKVRHSPRKYRIPLLELALPSASLMPLNQYAEFRKTIDDLIDCDLKIELFEMILRQMTFHYLDPKFRIKTGGKTPRPSYAELREDAHLLLGAIAWAGADNENEALQAFRRGWKEFSAEESASVELRHPDGLREIEKAWAGFRRASPEMKRRLLDAAEAAARHDSRLTLDEAEMLRGFSAVLDCPLPLNAGRIHEPGQTP
ncbi:MAG: M48 family metallopeptidase [Candidatus Omnitrophica bacterium]|nr:M48 family metallopeptidase [Candidatus Omnitrophota bacterium]